MSQLQRIKNKIKSSDSISLELSRLKNDGKKVVFTNGCFDILHKGHVTYLALASEQGDVLVLGLNSDDSVRRLGKGDDRPVNSVDARAMVVASLEFVDYVVEFNEDTPYELISIIQPDVLVKGGDYDPEEVDERSKRYIVGRDVVLENNGKVKTIDLVDGFSTTGIIKKLKDDN